MHQLRLSDEEEHVLRTLLDEAIADLGPEIIRTDTAAFREGLKEKRQILRRIRSGLEPAQDEIWEAVMF